MWSDTGTTIGRLEDENLRFDHVLFDLPLLGSKVVILLLLLAVHLIGLLPLLLLLPVAPYEYEYEYFSDGCRYNVHMGYNGEAARTQKCVPGIRLLQCLFDVHNAVVPQKPL